MRQLEDRIKDRLEGYESSLPEGDLAEFNALLDASAAVGPKRRPSYLAWLAPVAVAAGLAAFFIFGQGPQQDVIKVVDSSSLVADVVEAVEAERVEEETMVLAKPSGTRVVTQSDAIEAVREVMNEVPSEEPKTEDAASDAPEQSAPEQSAPEQVGNDLYSPLVPSISNSRKPVSVKVGKAAAGVIGGTGVVALAGMLPTLVMKSDYVYQDGEVSNPGGIVTDPEPPVDRRTGNDTHYMPLRAGLSLRFPFADRWSLTTGLDYSWYSSKLEYNVSGFHKQNVHYLEIPLRADYTVARNTWMQVYVGAGGAVDFCVAADEAGQKIARDGVGFSLVGAGGIQFNLSRNLGLFIDPTFSWDMTSGNRVLETFRSEHPVMISVSTGMRLTVPSKR